MNIRRWLACFALIALSLIGASATFADDGYPDKPIHLIVPYPPGGTSDILARSIAQELSRGLRQPIVVENRPGANGNIGCTLVAKASPDGYTLLMGSVGPLTINPALYRQTPFNPLTDFEPISTIAGVPLILVVNPSVRATSVKDLLSLAKTQPGKLTFASSGNGSTQHLAGELFRTMARVDIRHIPYRGAAPAMIDLLAGRVDMMFELSPAALPRIAAGKLRPLAVTTEKRISVAPQLPTLQEDGLPGFEVTSWFGILAPAGTPTAVVDKLNRQITQALTSPAVKERFANQGAVPMPSSRRQFQNQIKREIEKWAEVVRESGAKID